MNLFLLVSACLCAFGIAQSPAKSWWQTATFYQIYPRSFQDSNGDGLGDLKGIAQRLPYLKELGITATWLSPIFTSPMADFGYDIANFYEIDPLFGTMEDFDALMAKSEEVGIKVILDFVPNHSSDECEWFIRSAARDPEYEDFYVWHPGKMMNGIRQPPTNWLSAFRGSAWVWHEVRQEYYLHKFHRKQPDLNYRNPKVVETMKDVMRFWLRKGVAGFRVDALGHLFEVAADEQGNWPDEPRNMAVNDPDDYGYLHHNYTVDQPETIDMVYQFRLVMDEMQAKLSSAELILMTETFSPLEVVMQYYGNETMNGAQIPFNFELIWSISNSSNAYDYQSVIERWLHNMPDGRTANWVLGNHDQNRIGSRLGADRIDMMNMLLTTLPGCSITYQGEEIGMTDVWISWEETVDPPACNSSPELFEPLSRDPERTPFQWNDESNAGFSAGNATWLPIASNYKEVNVKRERGIALSHLNIYKQLQKLRHETTLMHGDTELKSLNANVLAIKRSFAGHTTFITLMNIYDDVEMVNLQTVFTGLSGNLQYVVITDKSPRNKGDCVRADRIVLMPKEAVILSTV